MTCGVDATRDSGTTMSLFPMSSSSDMSSLERNMAERGRRKLRALALWHTCQRVRAGCLRCEVATEPLEGSS